MKYLHDLRCSAFAAPAAAGLDRLERSRMTMRRSPGRNVIPAIFAAVVSALLGTSVLAQTGTAALVSTDCLAQPAPSSYPFQRAKDSAKGLPINQGIVPRGFVGLADGTPTVHGVDVSKWQGHADFKRVKDCTGRFSYIRLSAGGSPDNELEYRVHWANARAVGLLLGGYHYLTVPALTVSSESPPASNESDENTAQAREQARLFMRRLNEVLALDPIEGTQTLGRPILPITLAVGSASPNHKSLGADQLKQLGLSYTRAICAWITTIREDSRFKDVPIQLFVYPYIYKDYALHESDCGLSSIPIWVAYFSPDGGRAPPAGDSNFEAYALTCLREGANRCRFHLYTSYGEFLGFGQKAAVDLDRFYGTEDDLNALLHHVNR